MRWMRRQAVAFSLCIGLSASPSPLEAGHCFAIESDLPRLSGIRGAWLDDDRFVLADLKRARLLVYSAVAGFERAVLGALPAPLTFEEPASIAPWRGGFILADSTLLVHRLLALDGEATPVELVKELEWAGLERTPDVPPEWRFSLLSRLVATPERLFLLARREQSVIVELVPIDGSAGFRTGAEWPALPGEEQYWGMPGSQILAATTGDFASVYALRFEDRPFIQEIGGSGSKAGEGRRLTAFPDLVESLPDLPRGGVEVSDLYDSVLESSGHSVFLAAQGRFLYVLTKTLEEVAGQAWHLSRIDPIADALQSTVRLPTTAVYVSLLAGPKYWVLEEASSGSVDMFRQPTRLLVLDAEAVRSGEPITCD